MKKFFGAGTGAAIGTLIYTYFLSSSHDLDWYRAAFVGVFSGVCMAVWPQKKKH
jgi:ABC-type branched-subunit amino acid transport system permease subunit